MSKTYFIADTRFGHENILRLGKRPFNTIEEHDKALMDNWNKIVKPEDIVYILGDVSFKCDPLYYIENLKGHKILIKGNHDMKYLRDKEYTKHFEGIYDVKEIELDGKKIVLFHYPILEWNSYFKKSYHIFGHIHNARNKRLLEVLQKEPRMLNAGVEVNRYKPVTFEELIVNNNEYYNK